MNILKLWLPVVLWAAVIFYFSSIPNLGTGLDYDYFLRKCAHVTEYFILTFFVFRAMMGSFRFEIFPLFACSTFICLLYAASDEFHQTLVHGRHGTWVDVLIDAIGIFGFYAAVKIFPLILRR